METEEAIAFRRPRDVGDVISATFAYLRQNWRSLGRGLLAIVGPLLAVQLVVSSLFQAEMLSVMPSGESPTPREISAFYADALGPMLILFPVSFLTVMLVVGVVYEHMRFYDAHGLHPPGVGALWAGVKRSFTTVLTTMLGAVLCSVAAFVVVVMMGALTGAGLAAGVGPIGAGLGVLLMLLGIVAVGGYLLVFFALLFPVRIYEEIGLGAAFGRVRHLMKEAFWKSLGVVFTVTLLFYVIVVGFSIPSSVLGFLWGLGSASGSTPGTLYQVVLIVLSVVGGIGTTGAYAIPLVAAGLYYFGLVEEKEHVGLEARVRQVNEPGRPDENEEGRSDENEEGRSEAAPEDAVMPEDAADRQDDEATPSGPERALRDRWRPPGAKEGDA